MPVSPALGVACYQVSEPAPTPTPTYAWAPRRRHRLPHRWGDTFIFCLWPQEEESGLGRIGQGKDVTGNATPPFPNQMAHLSSPAGPGPPTLWNHFYPLARYFSGSIGSYNLGWVSALIAVSGGLGPELGLCLILTTLRFGWCKRLHEVLYWIIPTDLGESYCPRFAQKAL